MDEFDVYIPQQDPVSARVRDLVALSHAAKESYGVNGEALDKINKAMDLVLADLEAVIYPEHEVSTANVHVIPGGKH